MIDKSKTYRTRDGREVRIYAVDGTPDRPVHGAVKDFCGMWEIDTWTHYGTKGGNVLLNSDLIEVKPRIKREIWVNVHPNGVDDELYYTRESADQQSLPRRIACVKLTIDCEEGEGL